MRCACGPQHHPQMLSLSVCKSIPAPSCLDPYPCPAVIPGWPEQHSGFRSEEAARAGIQPTPHQITPSRSWRDPSARLTSVFFSVSTLYSPALNALLVGLALPHPRISVSRTCPGPIWSPSQQCGVNTLDHLLDLFWHFRLPRTH